MAKKKKEIKLDMNKILSELIKNIPQIVKLGIEIEKELTKQENKKGKKSNNVKRKKRT